MGTTTAFGKTVIGAWMIAKRKVNTLVLVHRQQLLTQWQEKLSLFLDIPIKQIGMIGSGKYKPQGTIDVAMLQSLFRNGEVDEVIYNYGSMQCIRSDIENTVLLAIRFQVRMLILQEPIY